jgi:hypothetical protein
VAAQLGCVEDADDQVRNRLARHLAAQHGRGHRFVRRTRLERVRAGKIEDPDPAPGGRFELPRLALDGHAGVVGDLLSRAGEQVEK